MFAPKRISNTIALSILGLMFILMFFSVKNESAIMDELAHIPAGYSYLTQKDYRLNPEHPPLIKDLASLPLLFLDLNFPTNVKAWSEDINGQWDMGRIFLYESGNNPDQILFWSRFPMMLLALLFGWFIFNWSRRLYGDRVGLLALLFFAFSPTFIAHSRYVTTDLAAAFGFFIGIVAFVRYLESPSSKRLIVSGAALGIALLFKFSVVLLVPFFILIALLWGFLFQLDDLRELNNNAARIKKILGAWAKLFLRLLAIFAVALLVMAAVYQFHVWNYPQDRQIRDSEFILSSFGFRPAADLTIFMAGKTLLRGLSEYLLGFLMVIQRAAGGNTAYFLGEVSSSGWWYYFPVAYLLKEPLAFLAMIVISISFTARSLYRAHEKTLVSALEWMRDNFFLVVGVLFIATYWWQTMSGNLNIGVRHVLPTFPFIYLLVSREITKWLRFHSLTEPAGFGEWLYSIYERYIKSLPRYFLFTLLSLWLVLSVIISFPNYLSYYNELAGGSSNGYKYIVDSNYDWGQDLRRLHDFASKNNINNIAVDYFGGGSPEHYFKDKFTPWWSAKGKPDPISGDPEWFAVSASIRQSSLGQPTKGFIKKSEDSYPWLQGLEPVSRAGLSIFIYKF